MINSGRSIDTILPKVITILYNLVTPVENEDQDFQIVLKRKSVENVPVQYHNEDVFDTSYFVTTSDLEDMIRYRYPVTKSLQMLHHTSRSA